MFIIFHNSWINQLVKLQKVCQMYWFFPSQFKAVGICTQGSLGLGLISSLRLNPACKNGSVNLHSEFEACVRPPLKENNRRKTKAHAYTHKITPIDSSGKYFRPCKVSPWWIFFANSSQREAVDYFLKNTTS